MAKEKDLFVLVSTQVNENFQDMIKRGDAIFMAPPAQGKLFRSYLEAFGGLIPEDRSLIFRGFNEHACMACSWFINHFGFITSIEKTVEGSYIHHTLWENMDKTIIGTEYEKPIQVLDSIVRESKIQRYFKPSTGWLEKDDIAATKTKAGNYIIGTPEEGLKDHFEGDTTKYFNHYVDGHEGLVTPVIVTDKGVELDIKSHKIPALVKRSATEEYKFHHYYLNVPKEYIIQGKDASFTTELHNSYAFHINAMREVFGPNHLVTEEAWNKASDLFKEKRLLLSVEKSWLVDLGKKVYQETKDLSEDELEDYLNYLCFQCTCTVDEQGRTKSSFVSIKKDVLFGGFLQPYSGTGKIREKDEDGNDIEVDGSIMKGNENYAISRYNTMADPANRGVKSEKALTAIEEFRAEKGVEEGGYSDSLYRRFATIEDIEKSNIDFYDGTKESVSGSKLEANQGKNFRLFKELREFKPALASKPGIQGGFIPLSRFDNCETITVEDLFKNKIPHSKNMNIFFPSTQEGNVAILTTSQNPTAKNILKWNNPFALITKDGTSYKSNLLKRAGENGSFVYAPFSASIFWSTDCDWDIHMLEYTIGHPLPYHLYFGSNNRIDGVTAGYRDFVKRCIADNKIDELNEKIRMWYKSCKKTPTGFVQDQDRTENRAHDPVVVENIFNLEDTKKIPEGTVYVIYAHLYDDCRNNPDQIKGQITINGNTTEYCKTGRFYEDDRVLLAVIVAEGNNQFKVIDGNKLLNPNLKITLPGSKRKTFSLDDYEYIADVTSKSVQEDDREVWGCRCGSFYPVEASCVSPNHMSKPAVGDLSYFFAIQNMRCDQTIKAYTQDSLSKEFTDKVGKRAAQYLATLPSMVLSPDPDQPQLAGLVYNTASSDVAIIKLGMPDGSEKVYRVTFGNV